MVPACLIGGKMIHAAFTDADEKTRADITKGGSLIMLSIATSIDALAVGLSLAVVSVGILFPSVVIGCVAALMTVLVYGWGKSFAATRKKMELIGGCPDTDRIQDPDRTPLTIQDAAGMEPRRQSRMEPRDKARMEPRMNANKRE